LHEQNKYQQISILIVPEVLAPLFLLVESVGSVIIKMQDFIITYVCIFIRKKVKPQSYSTNTLDKTRLQKNVLFRPRINCHFGLF